MYKHQTHLRECSGKKNSHNEELFTLNFWSLVFFRKVWNNNTNICLPVSCSLNHVDCDIFAQTLKTLPPKGNNNNCDAHKELLPSLTTSKLKAQNVHLRNIFLHYFEICVLTCTGKLVLCVPSIHWSQEYFCPWLEKSHRHCCARTQAVTFHLLVQSSICPTKISVTFLANGFCVYTIDSDCTCFHRDVEDCCNLSCPLKECFLIGAQRWGLAH